MTQKVLTSDCPPTFCVYSYCPAHVLLDFGLATHYESSCICEDLRDRKYKTQRSLSNSGASRISTFRVRVCFKIYENIVVGRTDIYLTQRQDIITEACPDKKQPNINFSSRILISFSDKASVKFQLCLFL